VHLVIFNQSLNVLLASFIPDWQVKKPSYLLRLHRVSGIKARYFFDQGMI